MRWLVPAACAFFTLFGCTSRPLETPAGEGDSSSPSAPLGPSDGAFRPSAAYPSGPFGSEPGAIIANLSFLGWRDPVRAGFDSSRLSELRFSDFYDPRGQETELIVVNASAVWCPACRSEMAIIDEFELVQAYRRSKVEILGTLFEDNDANPATPADLTLWANGLGFVVEFALALDPGLKLGPYFAQSVTPLNLVIDARTMEILQVYMGYSGQLWANVDAELRARGVEPPPPRLGL